MTRRRSGRTGCSGGSAPAAWAQVYLGKSPGGRLVAIKLIRPELAEERGFRSRFASEITAARNVSGIYTAAVVDADSDAELPWMATVYVPGPSLTDAVEDNGPLPVESVLALAAGLAEALQAIHRAGLVHRDLKPSNVLLAADGPRVIDFGISLALERSMMTATGMVMGSPGFMSPEQARGQREVGAPTDMFSLGAVLAFAATGNSPFGVGPTPALLYRVVNEVPDLTGVPARLSPLVEQCLAKDPADRPTPAEVLASLSDDVEVLTGEWLPPPIAESMVRYSPTLQTPLPPALKEQGQSQAASGPVPAGAPRQPLPVPRLPLRPPQPPRRRGLGSAAGTVQSGPVQPGVAGRASRLRPARPRQRRGHRSLTGRRRRRRPPCPAPPGRSATSRRRLSRSSRRRPPRNRSPPPGSSAASVPSFPRRRWSPCRARSTRPGAVPGGTGGSGRHRGHAARQAAVGLRRWRWPITAAAAAVIIAVVAVLLAVALARRAQGQPDGVARRGHDEAAGDPDGDGQPPRRRPRRSRPTPTPASQPAGYTPVTQPSATATSSPTSSPTSTPTSTTVADHESPTPTTIADHQPDHHPHDDPDHGARPRTPTTAAPTSNPSTAQTSALPSGPTSPPVS